GEFAQFYENTGPNPTTLEWTENKLDLILKWPDMATILLTVSQNEAHRYQAGSYDGRIDFGGTSGGSRAYPVTASGMQTITPQPLLDQFQGTGSRTFYLTATGSQLINASVNSIVGSTLSAGANLTVTYTFAVIPEPATWIAGGCGVLVLACSGLSVRRAVTE